MSLDELFNGYVQVKRNKSLISKMQDNEINYLNEFLSLVKINPNHVSEFDMTQEGDYVVSLNTNSLDDLIKLIEWPLYGVDMFSGDELKFILSSITWGGTDLGKGLILTPYTRLFLKIYKL